MCLSAAWAKVIAEHIRSVCLEKWLHWRTRLRWAPFSTIITLDIINQVIDLVVCCFLRECEHANQACCLRRTPLPNKWHVKNLLLISVWFWQTVSALQKLTLILSFGLSSWEVYDYQINLILQMLFLQCFMSAWWFILSLFILPLLCKCWTQTASTDRQLNWMKLKFQQSHAHGCKVSWFCGIIAAQIWWLMKGFYLYRCTLD